ncbi:MAG: hypothetical protein U9Q12_03765 [Patescibacteria group bacterium]|nr:hypothetical protein [Patescibacteria group bacterium]
MEQENKNEEQKEVDTQEQGQIKEISQKQVEPNGAKNNIGKTIFITILITIIVTGGFVFILYKYDQFIQAEQLDAQKEKAALENRIATLEKNKTNLNDVKSGTNTASTNTQPAQQNNIAPNDANTVPGESGESENVAPSEDDEDMRPAADHNPHDAMNQDVDDMSGLYSVSLPADWIITENKGAVGMQVSRVGAESPDFAYHTDPTFQGPFEPVYYDEGAMITIHLTQAQGPNAEEPIGVITQSMQTIVDGVMGEYYVFTEPSTFEGELLEVIFRKDGVEYSFRFVYNPDSYPQGPDVFAQILDSVKLN